MNNQQGLVLVKPTAFRREKTVAEMTANEMRDTYIRKLARPLNAEDWHIIQYAVDQAKLKCKNRRVHTYCVAKGRNRRMDYYGKPQLNCSRGREFNQCAEPSVVAEVEDANDIIVKLVVVHYKPGYTRPTVLCPCYKCVEILRRFTSPHATVIIKYKGQWMKFPIRRLILFAYPTKYKNKKANI